MRLSEAMMLGSVTCKMIPYDLNSCALGVACNAMGVAKQSMTVDRFRVIEELWPWTIDHDHLQEYPAYGVCSAKTAIWKRFDNLVCNGVMTLEQLVDYVRSIEPDCECNRFDCACKPAEVAEEIEVHTHA